MVIFTCASLISEYLVMENVFTTFCGPASKMATGLTKNTVLGSSLVNVFLLLKI
jgi:hypothetical protein